MGNIPYLALVLISARGVAGGGRGRVSALPALLGMAWWLSTPSGGEVKMK